MSVVTVDAREADRFVDDAYQAVYDADLSGVFRLIMADIEEDEAAMYAGNHGPNGEAWAPLADSTVRRKGHDTILRDTGRLWGSEAADEPPYAIRTMFDDGDVKGFVFGTSHPAAKFLQAGTKTMPARPHLGFTEDRIDRAIEMILDRVAEVLAQQVAERRAVAV